MRWLRIFLACVALASAQLAVAAESGVDFAAVVDELSREGDAAVAAYQPADGLESADRFSDLYFDVFEGSGMEQAVGLRDPQLKTRLEGQFATVIGAASQGHPSPEVAQAWQMLRNELHQTAQRYSGASASGFWAVFVQAFLILVREGFEAMLLVTALVAYLRKSGAGDKVGTIYYGVGWALLASLATAYLLTAVLDISGAGQEALEGITMLVAAVVLFYVSYWLISKREATRWQAYVREKIDSALSKGSLFALGLAAFLAVYREGAETVLFYQAQAGQAEGETGAIFAGFALATLALLGIYWAMRNAAIKLPLGIFFGVTAALLYYLAVSFSGHGILELQEAGWISISPIIGAPQLPWIGFFPSWEGLATQLVFLLPLIPAVVWWRLKRTRMLEANPG